MQPEALGAKWRAFAWLSFRNEWLPHAHIICILADADDPMTTDDYDIIVSAVIPGQDREHALWHTVTTSMMRGP